MDTESLRQESRETAIREVLRLLPSPSSLSTLVALRAEVARKKQATDAQLDASVGKQLERAVQGMLKLEDSQGVTSELEGNFRRINDLCIECKSLIENYEQISLLNTTRNNLVAVIQNAEAMLSIAPEAAAAQDLLGDEKELLNTYEKLCGLLSKRRFALAAVKTNKAELMKLREYFEDVGHTRDRFEDILWSHARNFVQISKENPVLMKRVIKVVEIQESLEQRAQGAEGTEGLEGEVVGEAPRCYRERLFKEMEAGIEERFESVQELVNDDIKELLEEATAVAQELADVCDFAMPCFPSRYNVFDRMIAVYNRSFRAILSQVAQRGTELDNNSILKLMSWIGKYQEQLEQLGGDTGQVGEIADSGALDPLVDLYIDRMTEALTTWWTRLLAEDKATPPKIAPDGFCSTPLIAELFRLFYEQLSQLQTTGSPAVLTRAGKAMVKVMLDFQAAEMEALKQPSGEVALESICATVNNNMRGADMCKELVDNIVQYLSEAQEKEIQSDKAVKGFKDVAKEGAGAVVHLVYTDQEVKKQVVDKLFTDGWLSGQVTEVLVATLEDYIQDIIRFLEERSFKRFAERLLERTAVIFVNQLLQQKAGLTEELLGRLVEDEKRLRDFFYRREYLTPQKIDKSIAALTDVRLLVASEDPEAFELNFSSLLQGQPDCPFEVLERIIALRHDISRDNRNEVLAHCKEIYGQHVASLDGPPPAGNFTNLPAFAHKSSWFS